MKNKFVEVIQSHDGFTTSSVIMESLGIDKKAFDAIKEELLSTNTITVTRGRFGGISLVGHKQVEPKKTTVSQPKPKTPINSDICDLFIKALERNGGFATSAFLVEELGIDKKTLYSIFEAESIVNRITISRGRNGGISLKKSDGNSSVEKPKSNPISKVMEIVPEVETVTPVKGKIGSPATIQKEFLAIGVTASFDIKKARNGTTFVLFSDWKQSALWTKVQEICHRHNVIADADNGIIWHTANKK